MSSREQPYAINGGATAAFIFSEVDVSIEGDTIDGHAKLASDGK